jgi:hypothetical protein
VRELPYEHVNEGRIEGRIELMGRQGRRCEQLPDDLKEARSTGN